MTDDPHGMVALSRRKAEKIIAWQEMMKTVDTASHRVRLAAHDGPDKTAAKAEAAAPTARPGERREVTLARGSNGRFGVGFERGTAGGGVRVAATLSGFLTYE